MRRRLVIGFGLAGVISGSAALGQFASDRQPTASPKVPTAAPGGVQLPVSPAPATPTPPVTAAPAGGSTLPPPSGVMPAGYQPAPPGLPEAPRAAPPPANLEIQTALG